MGFSNYLHGTKEEDLNESSEVLLESERLELLLGNVEGSYEKYTESIASFTMALVEEGLEDDDPIKEQMEQLVELHEELKTILWEKLQDIKGE